ncbi:helix-turn-helix domain-containing protein [Streptomyces sp. WM6378]|uniref:helix-turn-helix domain-containing protein n=1 Tax=Streptomyces sp. WM6378 TaxID=1415557 RepID=UPI00131AFABC|nr:helix-turn-helix transcriptional regulator [Streptomyces sp. WM6378]
MTKQQIPRPTQRMGDRIRAAREARGRSTQSAAAEAEISSGYLFKLESGYVGTPSPRVLHRLAQVLGLDYWELMGLAGYVVPDGAGAPSAVAAAPPLASPRPFASPGPVESPASRASPELPAPDALGRIADALEGIREELGMIREAMAAQENASRGENS